MAWSGDSVVFGRWFFLFHLRGLCGKNMLDVCCFLASYDEYIAMVNTENECQRAAYMLLLGKYPIAVCCAEVLFQPSFLPVVGTWHAEWSTERTTARDIAQTERVLTRLVDTASLDSRSQAKECFHNIHVLSLFHPVLSLPVLHAHLFVDLGFTLRAW